MPNGTRTPGHSWLSQGWIPELTWVKTVPSMGVYVRERGIVGERDLVNGAGMWTWELWVSVFDPTCGQSSGGNSQKKRWTQMFRDKQKWKMKRCISWVSVNLQVPSCPLSLSLKAFLPSGPISHPSILLWLSQLQWIFVSCKQWIQDNTHWYSHNLLDLRSLKL